MITPWITEEAQSGAGAFSRIWSDGSTIWAAGGDTPGIYKSNGGGTWAISLAAGSYVFGGGYAAISNNVFVAQHSTAHPYLYTTDGGANWYPADPIVIGDVTINTGYAIGGIGASYLWLLAMDNYGNHYIIKTTDGGANWTIDYGPDVAEWNTIQVVSDSDIWVGCTTQILHWDGAIWDVVYVDLSYYMPICVWEESPGNTFIGYASADFVHAGGVFKWDGATLTPCTLVGQSTTTRIGAVSGYGTHLWAVDTNNAGTIYHSLDGGSSWIWDGPVYSPQTNADFYDICETLTKVYTVGGYSTDGASILGASTATGPEITEEDTVTAVDNTTIQVITAGESDSIDAIDVAHISMAVSRRVTDTVSTVDAVTGESLPTVYLAAPLDGSTSVARNAPILVYFRDGMGAPIDDNSIVIVVDGITVFETLSPERGWSGRLTTLSPGTRLLMLYSPEGFEYNSTVTIDVSANY